MARLIVVDDENHIRKLYREFFIRAGHSVETAQNGVEALKLTEENEFDLMILDVELEDENGLELLKQIKTGSPNLPVILNSAFSVYKSDFSTWFADAYMVKSADLNLLNEKIKELVTA